MIIDSYINAGTPRPLEEVRDKAFKWKHGKVLLKKPTEAKKLKFEKGFPISYVCGQIYIVKSEVFLKYIYEKHKGVAPPTA